MPNLFLLLSVVILPLMLWVIPRLLAFVSAERRRQRMICWPVTQGRLEPGRVGRVWTEESDVREGPGTVVSTREYTYFFAGARRRSRSIVVRTIVENPEQVATQLLEGTDSHPVAVNPADAEEAYLALPVQQLSWGRLLVGLTFGLLFPVAYLAAATLPEAERLAGLTLLAKLVVGTVVIYAAGRAIYLLVNRQSAELPRPGPKTLP